MPFTPIHMGPGLAVKAALGRRFSLMVFGFSQVAMDIEPLVRMIRGDTVIHGFTHTYLGATIVGVVAALVGRPLCNRLLRFFRPGPGFGFLQWLGVTEEIGWRASLTGAFIGTYSHVLLDSVMHSDMAPLFPWRESNFLQGAISIEALHMLCVASGLIAVAALCLVYLLWGRRQPRFSE
jgi:hypothetical protein